MPHLTGQATPHRTPGPAAYAERVRQAALVPPAALDAALTESRQSGRPLEELLAEQNPAAEADLYRLLAACLGIGFDDLTDHPADSALAQYLPSSIAFHHGVAPLSAEGGVLTLAAARLAAFGRLDELSAFSGLNVAAVLSPPKALQRYVRSLYGLGAQTVEKLISAADAADSPAAAALQILAAETHAIDAPLDSAQQATITQFVNEMLLQAIRERASDIHIEPYEHHLRVRFRIDGVLQEVSVPANLKQLEAAIISRVKVLANLDIADKRLCQDGQMRLFALERAIDVRVSVVPTIYGESVVLRLLDPQVQVARLGQLGMPADMLAAYRDLLGLSQGLILVTGPTGSGKTTTLYTSLHHINQPERKIVTVEDPVEYRLEGISQVQVKDAINLGFSTLLRNLVRHDPDVIMIGEIRDAATGQIALNSAITGHLVLSTLHTNDAPTAVVRLLNMGMPAFLIAAALRVVVAQRLVRLICPRCKAPAADPLAPEVARAFPALEGRTLYRGAGCDACHHTGYHGRTGIYEFFLISRKIESLIADHAPSPVLRAAAVEAGMVPLRDAGLARVLAGETTIEEVYRVSRDVPEETEG